MRLHSPRASDRPEKVFTVRLENQRWLNDDGALVSHAEYFLSSRRNNMPNTQTAPHHTAQATQCQKPPWKLSFTQPRMYPLGKSVASTGQGANEHESCLEGVA